MSRIQTPTNQKRLTNVVFVKYKTNGIRFELACYPNKVQNFRDGIEKDIDEVLQSPQIFTNVSKGEFAKAKDLQKGFGKKKEHEIILEILTKGEVQSSGKERERDSETLLKDIATIVSEKTIDPTTKRPITITMIEKAMKSSHFSVKPNQTAKKQALEVIKLLISEQKIAIERAPMRIKVGFPAADEEKVAKAFEKFAKEIESKEKKKIEEKDLMLLTCIIDPSAYRDIADFLKKEIPKDSTIEVINLTVTSSGDSKIE